MKPTVTRLITDGHDAAALAPMQHLIVGDFRILTHVTNTLRAIHRGAPVDLVFQSIASTEAANRNFGIDLAKMGRRNPLLDRATPATYGVGPAKNPEPAWILGLAGETR